MIELVKGSVYYVYPENDSAKIHDAVNETDKGITTILSSYGWHGNDVNPVNLEGATWIADGRIGDSESDGALVIVEGEMVQEDLAEGWKFRKVEIPDGWYYVDNGGGYRIRHFYDDKFVMEIK